MPGQGLWGFENIKFAQRPKQWWDDLPNIIGDAANTAMKTISEYKRQQAAEAQRAEVNRRENEKLELEKKAQAARELNDAETLMTQRYKSDQDYGIAKQRAAQDATEFENKQSLEQGKLWGGSLRGELHDIDTLRSSPHLADLASIYAQGVSTAERNPGSMLYYKDEDLGKMKDDVRAALAKPEGAEMLGLTPEQLSQRLAGVKAERKALAQEEALSGKMALRTQSGSESKDVTVARQEMARLGGEIRRQAGPNGNKVLDYVMAGALDEAAALVDRAHRSQFLENVRQFNQYAKIYKDGGGRQAENWLGMTSGASQPGTMQSRGSDPRQSFLAKKAMEYNGRPDFEQMMQQAAQDYDAGNAK